MTVDRIRYDLLAQEALRGMLRKVLTDTARDGLPDEHHFYISFATQYPGVKISHRLAEKYPQDMTIVIQHQFWDLVVNDYAFEIGLSFNGIPERLLIPFHAIKSFFDPYVKFGLQFEPVPVEGQTQFPPELVEKPKKTTKSKNAGAQPIAGEATTSEKLPKKPTKKTESEGGAEIVSLDKFRKK